MAREEPSDFLKLLPGNESEAVVMDDMSQQDSASPTVVSSKAAEERSKSDLIQDSRVMYRYFLRLKHNQTKNIHEFLLFQIMRWNVLLLIICLVAKACHEVSKPGALVYNASQLRLAKQILTVQLD